LTRITRQYSKGQHPIRVLAFSLLAYAALATRLQVRSPPPWTVGRVTHSAFPGSLRTSKPARGRPADRYERPHSDGRAAEASNNSLTITFLVDGG